VTLHHWPLIACQVPVAPDFTDSIAKVVREPLTKVDVWLVYYVLKELIHEEAKKRREAFDGAF
jgi:hypothetical protein